MAPKRSVKTFKSTPQTEGFKLKERPISKMKKQKKSYHSFSIYLYKILKSINIESAISRQSMLIMNNFVMDMMEKLAEEAGRLIVHGKKHTLSSRDIQTAVKLLVPGELAKHAHIQGVKALNMYHKSKDTDTQ